ncbi:MAG: hypothetical protein Q8N15_01655, partial [Bacillota bacterium]|nr:hypothetical protein [Bacillota bacterium]
CHGSLYFFGLTRLKTEVFPRDGKPTLYVGMGMVLLNAIVSRPLANPDGRLFIYELLDGIHVRSMMSASTWQTWSWVYYITLILLVLWSFRLFYRLNVLFLQKATQAVPACRNAHANRLSNA